MMRSWIVACCLLAGFTDTASAAIRVPTPSIVPVEDGALIFSNATRLDLAGNQSLQERLGFTVTIGRQQFDSLFVNENGLISFGTPPLNAAGAPAGFTPVTSLANLGLPVIAPFYADLAEQPAAGTTPAIGSVYLEYGYLPNDPSTIAGERLTWYGLPVTGGNPGAESSGTGPAYAQLFLANAGGGDFNFEFRFDSPGDSPPNQDGRGSLQGFVLGGTSFQHDGPYTADTPANFAVRGGAVGAVPEPATWMTMILGVALLGAGLRRRSRRTGQGSRPARSTGGLHAPA